MSRVVITIVVVAVVVYVGLCAALFFSQRSLIYFPQPRSRTDIAPILSLQVDGEAILVTTRAGDGPDAVVYFGGNAEDVSYNLPILTMAFPKHALYLLHYRGYGGSSGKPSEAALFADALALFDKVHAEHPNITAIGRSLGSGVAVYLASQRPVSRLVLVTPYDSIQEIAARQFSYFPVRWLLLDKFESSKRAPAITAPTLVIAAEHDEVIPRATTDSLFVRFRRGVASYHVVTGAGHNTISESPEYIPLLKSTQ